MRPHEATPLLAKPQCPRLPLDSPLGLRLQKPRIPPWGLTSTRPVPASQHPAPYTGIYRAQAPSIGARCGWPPFRPAPGPLPTCPLAELLSPPAEPEPPQGRAGPTHRSARSRAQAVPEEGVAGVPKPRAPSQPGPQPACPTGGGSACVSATLVGTVGLASWPPSPGGQRAFWAP